MPIFFGYSSANCCYLSISVQYINIESTYRNLTVCRNIYDAWSPNVTKKIFFSLL